MAYENDPTSGGVNNADVVTGYPFIVEKSTSGGFQYVGLAIVGTATSDAKWRILRKNTTSGQIRWADAGSFNNIWNNRTSLTYS